MTVELRPGGVACNLACTYCYQEPIRVASGNKMGTYDIDLMLAEVEKANQNFSLFGGEALLIPKKDLERLWKYGYEKFKKNGIQTNGTLIDDDHIELFKKYNVHVGISIDGPGDLNSLREKRGKEGDEEAAFEGTKSTISNIARLKKEGVGVGIIITLHRKNGTPEKLKELMKFIEWLGRIGVVSGNIHVLEVDETMPDQEKHVLTQEENIEAFLTLAEFFEERKHLSWQPFRDIKVLLSGNDRRTNCYWRNCDPLNTKSVYGIEGNGALSNCGRTNKEGIDWYKSDKHNYSRYISFYYTPDEMGGCQGCRFWSICGGSCPGEAEQNDFRNKTIHCPTQYAMLEHYEKKLQKEGKTPFTLSPDLPRVEEYLLTKMKQGEAGLLHRAIYYAEQKRQEQEKKPNMITVPVYSGENETKDSEKQKPIIRLAESEEKDSCCGGGSCQCSS